MFLWIETADKSIKKQYHFFVLSFWDIWIDMRKKRFKKNACLDQKKKLKLKLT